MKRSHFYHDLVQRQIAFGRQPLSQPDVKGGQLAYGMIALPPRRKGPSLPLQDHQIVHEFRRNEEVTCGLTMPMTRLNKGDDTAAKLNRMRFAHSDPP